MLCNLSPVCPLKSTYDASIVTEATTGLLYQVLTENPHQSTTNPTRPDPGQRLIPLATAWPYQFIYLFVHLGTEVIIKLRRMRWAGHVARMREKRNAYRLLVGKPEGKRPLGRPRRRWMDNIRMALGEVGWSDVDWIGLAQDRNRWRALVNSVLNLRVP
jgi:hypothetical protein